MDRPIRTFVKSVTWQVSGLVTMTAIGYGATGSLSAGGGIALTGAATGFVAFFLHERLWARIRWGRQRNV